MKLDKLDIINELLNILKSAKLLIFAVIPLEISRLHFFQCIPFRSIRTIGPTSQQIKLHFK
jgi:hypothetical protein